MMEEFHIPKIRTCIHALFLYFVNGMCLAFVIWQTYQCMSKYIHKPQVTTVSMKKTAQLLEFPAITICGSFGTDAQSEFEMGFNPKYLEDFCGIRYFT